MKLKCGEEVLLSGTLYTARDAAHKRLAHLAAGKKRMPFPVKDSIIYYTGPTPRMPDGLFGSCGPTTSSRMDIFTPYLLEIGLGGMIGKGRRSDKVRRCIKKHKAVYFLAIGGAGAYLAKKIKSSKLIAFEGLGPEAIYKLNVRDFPLIVGVDAKGNDIFDPFGFAQGHGERLEGAEP
jgi:fumarate hydratase subunit beta